MKNKIEAIIAELEDCIEDNDKWSIKYPQGSESRGWYNGVACQAKVTLAQLKELINQ